MSRSTLPKRFFVPVGFRKDGRPIFPIAGGSEPPNQQTDGTPPGDGTSPPPGQQQSTGPEMFKDEDGRDLYPLNTAVKDMTPEQQAGYWRTESKKQQRLREDAERRAGQNNGGSGTVRDQQQTQGAQLDDAAVQAKVDAARREGQRDAVVVSLTASLQMRGKTADEITEILDVIDPVKFLDANGKVDTTKVANHLARVAPAGTNNGGGGAPGQGRQGDSNQRTDPREIAREEAKRRGHLDPGANRGALGGLRK